MGTIDGLRAASLSGCAKGRGVPLSTLLGAPGQVGSLGACVIWEGVSRVVSRIAVLRGVRWGWTTRQPAFFCAHSQL
eukprot:3447731-Alexandrium_andersonii.AAC.1